MKLLLSLLAAGLLAHAAAAATAPTIPNCFSQEIAPSDLVLACGDGNFAFSEIAWTDWGSTEATGNGVANTNDCTPNCAAGTFHSYPVNLIASGLMTCASGRRQYTHLAWSSQAKPPPGQDNLAGETSLPCGWKLHPGLTGKRSGASTMITGTAWTLDPPCPAKVTLTSAGKRLATVKLGARGGFAYKWRIPAGRHLVVARQPCGASMLYEAVVVVR